MNSLTASFQKAGTALTPYRRVVRALPLIIHHTINQLRHGMPYDDAINEAYAIGDDIRIPRHASLMGLSGLDIFEKIIPYYRVTHAATQSPDSFVTVLPGTSGAFRDRILGTWHIYAHHTPEVLALFNQEDQLIVYAAQRQSAIPRLFSDSTDPDSFGRTHIDQMAGNACRIDHTIWSYGQQPCAPPPRRSYILSIPEYIVPVHGCLYPGRIDYTSHRNGLWIDNPSLQSITKLLHLIEHEMGHFVDTVCGHLSCADSFRYLYAKDISKLGGVAHVRSQSHTHAYFLMDDTTVSAQHSPHARGRREVFAESFALPCEQNVAQYTVTDFSGCVQWVHTCRDVLRRSHAAGDILSPPTLLHQIDSHLCTSGLLPAAFPLTPNGWHCHNRALLHPSN